MSDGGVVVAVDVEEEGFSGAHSRGTGDFSKCPIKKGRSFAKQGSMKEAEHMHVEGSCVDHREGAFIPASLSGAGMVEKVGAASDHHRINVGIINKGTSLVKQRRSGRANSLPWILHTRRLLLLFAMLSSMGTMILIYLTIQISKGKID